MKPLIVLTALNCVVCGFFIIKGRFGDSGPAPNQSVQAEREWTPFDLDDEPGKLSLKDLLKKPRAELARMADECEEQIKNQEKRRRGGELLFKLLPASSRFAMVWPVWREAKYSSERGMILPPYLSEKAFDSKLALHLARFGDAEAARKIVDPGDAAAREEIDRLAWRNNYPAEWTRLVAMILHQAHYSLAESDNHAARKVVALHRQLANLLNDNEVRKSPLATALLSRGQLLLHEAVMAWMSQPDHEEYIDLASRGLAEWAEYAVPVLPPARSAKELAEWLGGRHDGLLVASNDTLRALDMLELPLPSAAAEGVVGLFEPSGKLREILVVYGQMDDVYEVKKLTYWLDEQIASSSPVNVPFRLEQYPGSKEEGFESVIAPLAVVRLAPKTSEPEKVVSALPRDLGPMHLDRTFETNRRHFAWLQSGPRLTVSDGALSGLKWPFAGQKFSQATMTRDAGADVVADVQLVLNKAPAGRSSFISVASPIWQKRGASRYRVTGSTGKDTFNLIWSDGATQLSLCFPHNQEAPYVELRDGSGTKLEQRLHAAQKRDADERQARWAENKPLVRVQRSIDLFQLGMTRGELEVRLRARKTLRNDTRVGDLLTFPGTPQEGVDWVVRQALVRFDETGRLTEARLRITDAPDKKPGSTQRLLTNIRSPDMSGAPQLVADTDKFAAAEKSPAKVMRWQDDATYLQARVDVHGIEILLKDCPPEYPEGEPLPAAKWLPEGPGPECLLGARKSDLFARWKLVNPTPESDGGFALRPNDKSPYEWYLVFFTGDKATRILACHKQAGEPLTQTERADKAVRLAWGQNAQAFGWPWHQTFNGQGHLKSWSSHDEATQVRIFWQRSQIEGVIRVYTEWK